MPENVVKMTKFVWDDIKRKAVEALAKAEKNKDKIAAELGTSRRTLERWEKHPDFQAKLNEAILDIDVSQKAERIKIAKAEIKRILSRLEYNEDKPCSRDLITALRYVGEEMGDYEPIQRLKGEIAVKIIDDIPRKEEPDEGDDK